MALIELKKKTARKGQKGDAKLQKILRTAPISQTIMVIIVSLLVESLVAGPLAEVVVVCLSLSLCAQWTRR